MSFEKEDGWYKGVINDGLIKKKRKPRPPFLTMFRIMPSQGEIEKYCRLTKGKGFVGLNMRTAAQGKRMELEPSKKAVENPGKLTDLKDIMKVRPPA